MTDTRRDRRVEWLVRFVIIGLAIAQGLVMASMKQHTSVAQTVKTETLR